MQRNLAEKGRGSLKINSLSQRYEPTKPTSRIHHLRTESCDRSRKSFHPSQLSNQNYKRNKPQTHATLFDLLRQMIQKQKRQPIYLKNPFYKIQRDKCKLIKYPKNNNISTFKQYVRKNNWLQLQKNKPSKQYLKRKSLLKYQKAQEAAIKALQEESILIRKSNHCKRSKLLSKCKSRNHPKECEPKEQKEKELQQAKQFQIQGSTFKIRCRSETIKYHEIKDYYEQKYGKQSINRLKQSVPEPVTLRATAQSNSQLEETITPFLQNNATNQSLWHNICEIL